MSTFIKRTVRCIVDLDDADTPFRVVGRAETPAFWAGAGVRFEFLFTRTEVITAVDNFATMTMVVLAASRTGSPLMTATISSFDNTVTAATWADGTKQHAVVEFPGVETALAITAGALYADYYLVLHGATTDATEDPDVFGWSKLRVWRPGVPTDANPVQAGNLIPGDAAYDVSGEYALTVTAARFYKWTQGANDTDLVNGTETVSTSNQNFITQGTSVTLRGTPEALVTAVVRAGIFLTSDEVLALITSQVSTGGVIQGEQEITVGQAGLPVVTVDISAHALVGAPNRINAHVIAPNTTAVSGHCTLVAGWTANEFEVVLSFEPEESGFKIGYTLVP